MIKTAHWQPRDWIAATTLAVTLLVILVGTTGWMTGMYIETKGLRADFEKFGRANAEVTYEHRRRLDDHEVRITRNEGR